MRYDVFKVFVDEVEKSAASMQELAGAAKRVLRKKDVVRLRRGNDMGSAVQSIASRSEAERATRMRRVRSRKPDQQFNHPLWQRQTSLKNYRRDELPDLLHEGVEGHEALRALSSPGREHLSAIQSSRRGGFVGGHQSQLRKADPQMAAAQRAKLQNIPADERGEMYKGLNSFVNIHEANELQRAKRQTQLSKKRSVERLIDSAQDQGHQDVLVPLLDHNMMVTARGKGSEGFKKTVGRMRADEADKYNEIVRPILGDDTWTYGKSPKLNRHARKKIERALARGELEDGRRFSDIEDLRARDFMPPRQRN